MVTVVPLTPRLRALAGNGLGCVVLRRLRDALLSGRSDYLGDPLQRGQQRRQQKGRLYRPFRRRATSSHRRGVNAGGHRRQAGRLH